MWAKLSSWWSGEVSEEEKRRQEEEKREEERRIRKMRLGKFEKSRIGAPSKATLQPPKISKEERRVRDTRLGKFEKGRISPPTEPVEPPAIPAQKPAKKAAPKKPPPSLAKEVPKQPERSEESVLSDLLHVGHKPTTSRTSIEFEGELSFEVVKEEVLFRRLCMEPHLVCETESHFTVLEYVAAVWARTADCPPAMEEEMHQLKALVLEYLESSINEPSIFPTASEKPHEDALRLFRQKKLPATLVKQSCKHFVDNDLDDEGPNIWGQVCELIVFAGLPVRAVALPFQPVKHELPSALEETSSRTLDELATWTGISKAVRLCAVKRLAPLPTSVSALEAQSWLGRVLGIVIFPVAAKRDLLSVLMPENLLHGLPMRKVLDQANSVLPSVASCQIQQGYLLKNLCTTGAAGRAAVFSWCLAALNLQFSRCQDAFALMAPGFAVHVSDDFALNLFNALLVLAEPLTEGGPEKAARFDWSIFGATSAEGLLFVQADEPYLKLREAEAAEDCKVEGFKPLSIIAALGVQAMHTGLAPIIKKLQRKQRIVGQMLSMLRRGEDPGLDLRLKNQLAEKYAMEAVLSESGFVNRMLQFILFIVESLNFQLKESADHLLENCPQHVLEDILDSVSFLAKIKSTSSLLSCSPLMQPLLDLLLTLSSLDRSHGVSSPHLRAKIGSTLYSVFVPEDVKDGKLTLASTGPLSAMFLAFPLSQQKLSGVLMRLYGDVEETGAYEKVNYRYELMVMLQWILEASAEHKAFFAKFCGRSSDGVFSRFGNGILNQTNDLLTGALSKLPEIRELQSSSSLEQEQLQNLSEMEDSVASSLRLVMQTMRMLNTLTREFPDAWLTEELAPRVASTFHTILSKLAGPARGELKVQRMDLLHFHPKKMLELALFSVLQLARAPSFVNVFASQGFQLEAVFSGTLKIARRFSLLPERECQSLQRFFDQVVEEKERLAERQGRIDESSMPGEFLDPILYIPMTNPVKLPSSGVVVDRLTIQQHLMNDASDPFSRDPLKLEDVIPDIPLQERIAEWMQDHP